MLTKQTLQIPEEVVYEKIGEEAVLLQLETGAYFGLNTVGSRIWELLAATGNPESIMERIHDEFDVARDLLEQDLENLIGELKAKKLIQVSADN